MTTPPEVPGTTTGPNHWTLSRYVELQHAGTRYAYDRSTGPMRAYRWPAAHVTQLATATLGIAAALWIAWLVGNPMGLSEATRDAVTVAAWTTLLLAVALVLTPIAMYLIPESIGLTTTYFTESGDAMLVILRAGRSWRISNHCALEPGSGQGEQLRKVLLPSLARYVDYRGITLRLTAGNARLAAKYAHEIPGLIPTTARGTRALNTKSARPIRMVRHPHP